MEIRDLGGESLGCDKKQSGFRVTLLKNLSLHTSSQFLEVKKRKEMNKKRK